MRKYLMFLLILMSCQKEELFEVNINGDIFSQNETLIYDNQVITFETLTSEKYTIIIINPDNNSVVTKETFISIKGVNTKNIFTKALPKQRLKLVLLKGSEEIKSTFIRVE